MKVARYGTGLKTKKLLLRKQTEQVDAFCVQGIVGNGFVGIKIHGILHWIM